jgi:hypothetical protein
LSGTSGADRTLSPLWLASPSASSGHRFPYPRLVSTWLETFLTLPTRGSYYTCGCRSVADCDSDVLLITAQYESHLACMHTYLCKLTDL